MSRIEDPDFQKYKFRDLKVYGSTEWLAENKKKYRQVFDRYETNYIYAELSFYNKFFDVEDWNASINLKCYSLKKVKKEICDLQLDRIISKYDHVVYIREGWGNKKLGTFWKKGSYCWEAYIDGEKQFTKHFYIEETSEKYFDISLYADLKSVKLFESKFEETYKDERVYLRAFSSKDTRYINVEIILDNHLKGKSWNSELNVRFLNASRQLKGQATQVKSIEANEEQIEFVMQWGSNIMGTWSEGDYFAEIVMMDKLLATVHFDVQEYNIEGIPTLTLPNLFHPVFLNEEVELEDDFDTLMIKMDELIGLTQLKKQVIDHANYINFLKLRIEKGFVEEDEINIHSVFIGNPGTGKTTVAKMMGKLYKSMGLLTSGHVCEVDRVDLVGEYIGQTAPKVKEAIERARGGVLFIDEAYSLARAQDDSKDFGREVIEILVKEMSSGNGDLAVIAAGYPKEMKYFLESNPGLKSRFKLFFDFPDYLPEELSAIADLAAQKKSVTFTESAKNYLDEIITESYRKRDKSFGNARFVFDLIEKAKVNLGLRIMSSEKPNFYQREELARIELTDIEKIEVEIPKKLPNLSIDEKSLDKALSELRDLVGMNNIKSDIEEMVNLVRFYKESGRNVLNKFYLHTVFVGNPGTGKTTVARILTKIYKALGILERGHTVETDRQGLVAGYVGQTAIKTAEKIDESLGGVLFIDEAYALSVGSSGNMGGASDFGNEAIQTLLKRMEDSRGQFFVFVAGYPDNMETFLKANPGLKSRFDKILKFEDYSAEELFEISVQMLDQEGLVLNEEAQGHLKNYLFFVYEYRDKYFGNARSVRNIVNEITKNQSLRLASIPLEDRAVAILNLITYEDVTSLKLNTEDEIFSKKSIGFRKQAGAGN
jgi:SpoVK/Ycf46/Vps4 family AAA+-type ATPase